MRPLTTLSWAAAVVALACVGSSDDRLWSTAFDTTSLTA